MASVLKPEIKINPIFRESLATGGSIFSEAHQYFKISIPPDVEAIKQRLKTKLCLN